MRYWMGSQWEPGKGAISVADVYVAYRNVQLDIIKLQKKSILHIIYHV